MHDVIHLKSSLKWPKILQIHGNRDRSSLKGAHQVSPAMFQVHLEQSNMELMVIIAIINIEKKIQGSIWTTRATRASCLLSWKMSHLLRGFCRWNAYWVRGFPGPASAASPDCCWTPCHSNLDSRRDGVFEAQEMPTKWHDGSYSPTKNTHVAKWLQISSPNWWITQNKFNKCSKIADINSQLKGDWSIALWISLFCFGQLPG